MATRIWNFVSYLWLFGCVVLHLRAGRAQVKTGAADSVLIRYSRSTPQSVLRLMPRGAKSLFWGKFTPKKGSAALAVHLFSPPRKLASEESGRKTYIHFYEFDIFQLSRRTARKVGHASFTRTLVDYGHDDKYISKLHLLWLNKGKSDVPVIAFDYFTTNTGTRFPYGEGTFLVFDSTWKQGHEAGKFSFGRTGGAGSQWGYEVGRDERGQLLVMSQESDMNGTSRWHHSYDPNKRVFIKDGSINSPRD